MSAWNERLTNFVVLGQKIRPGSTVLWLTLEPLDGAVNPYRDAVGLLSPKAVIDLRNYEASADHFLTQWQPERSPVPALGTVLQLGEYRPCSTRQPERHGRVDYNFQGHPDSRGMSWTLIQFVSQSDCELQTASPDQHAPGCKKHIAGCERRGAYETRAKPGKHRWPSGPPAAMDLVYNVLGIRE